MAEVSSLVGSGSCGRRVDVRCSPLTVHISKGLAGVPVLVRLTITGSTRAILMQYLVQSTPTPYRMRANSSEEEHLQTMKRTKGLKNCAVATRPGHVLFSFGGSQLDI